MRFLASVGTILLVCYLLAHLVVAVKDKQTNDNNPNNDNNQNNEGRQHNNQQSPQQQGDPNSSSPPANDTFPSQGYPGYGGLHSRRQGILTYFHLPHTNILQCLKFYTYVMNSMKIVIPLHFTS